ncbi:MAG: DUF58 domain-containing protein [Woeseia sp.]|nr:DUF58 domain-containing protein [Woeseia sp.]NNE60476.1 DUF58 domain-containing protein [Woeseia sp.]NNL55896.1 DUF58 domain-containing protein [Woeseia sp.]
MSSIQWLFPEHLRPRFVRQRLTSRIAKWARKRQGRDSQQTALASRRIYILPTAVGMVFALMVFAMLLGSMNYNNNLSFVLTFMLASLSFVAMHQCQRNLVGLELSFAGAEPVHAGRPVEFRIAVRNRSRSSRYQLQLYADKITSTIVDLAPGESQVMSLEIPTSQRGHLSLPRFGIRSTFPFEQFRAWSWLHMDLTALVWPTQAPEAPLPPPALAATGHRQHDARGEEDFAGLRSYAAGDSPRHLAWKAFARSGELLSKQFAGADTSSQWFDFDSLDEADVEKRLSILTRWVVDAEREQRDYGLRLPGVEFPPAHGGAQRQQVLSALALYGSEQL